MVISCAASAHPRRRAAGDLPHPPLALISLRAIRNDRHEVAPDAPLHGVRELVERLRRRGEGERADELDARADEEALDGVERWGVEACELDVAEAVVRELREGSGGGVKGARRARA